MVHRKMECSGCHGRTVSLSTSGEKKIAIVGSPNVGKSVLFGRLTGAYATVSNYPGTTVEVSRGKVVFGKESLEVVDTPGMYSYLPVTEEERVARSILLDEKPDLILHVVDAKNLERMLPLTIQLLETGLPLILVLNIMDEAEKLGMGFDLSLLRKRLGIPVVATVSTSGKGVDLMKEEIVEELKGSHPLPSPFRYEEPMESSLKELEHEIGAVYETQKRSLASLLIQGDREIGALVKEREEDPDRIASLVEEIGKRFQRHLGQPSFQRRY